MTYGWPEEHDYHDDYRVVKYGIMKAYQALRGSGYHCHDNFYCCQNCGRNALGDEVEKFVFWHAQDEDDLRQSGEVFLAWDGDGKEIVKALKAQPDLKVTWDGSELTRIKVSAKKKKKKKR